MLQLLCGPLFHLSADGMAGPGDRHLYPLRHLTSLSFLLRHPLCTCETVLSPGHPSASVSHGTHLYTLNIGSACFLSSHPGSIPTLGDLVLSQPRGHLGLLTSPFSYPMSRLCDCVSVTQSWVLPPSATASTSGPTATADQTTRSQFHFLHQAVFSSSGLGWEPPRGAL